MEPTAILMEEHRVIEPVLRAMKKQADALQTGAAVRAGFFLEAGDFIRNFADGCHHRKEEGVLFPAMVDGGLSKYTGPIAIMLAEHAQARVITKAMLDSASQIEAGAGGAALETARSAA